MTSGKNNVVKVLSGITLESAYDSTQAAASRVVIDTSDDTNLNLFCSYTAGAAETSNSCEIIVEGYVGAVRSDIGTYGTSPDAAINADSGYWVQLGESTISGGTATFTGTVFQIAATVADTYKAHFKTAINFPKIRVAAKETGVTTNKGTLTVVAVCQ